MKYVTDYEHLKDELVIDSKTRWDFNRVKDSANKYKLELSDDEFKSFLKLQASDKDVGWIMHNMSAYKITFVDSLISYITY